MNNFISLGSHSLWQAGWCNICRRDCRNTQKKYGRLNNMLLRMRSQPNLGPSSTFDARAYSAYACVFLRKASQREPFTPNIAHHCVVLRMRIRFATHTHAYASKRVRWESSFKHICSWMSSQRVDQWLLVSVLTLRTSGGKHVHLSLPIPGRAWHSPLIVISPSS